MSQAGPVGQTAPDFSLPSIQGDIISLSGYHGRKRVVLWFSRGFTCPFCRSYMEGVSEGYDALQANDIEVVQVAPNLMESARIFFRGTTPPYPFICDPDKTLYARYGLGDRGVLEATRNTFISFGHSALVGEFSNTVRGSWLDVVNRNFMRRLHHHALTSFEQGLFFIDRQGAIRHQQVLGAMATIPAGMALLQQMVQLDG